MKSKKKWLFLINLCILLSCEEKPVEKITAANPNVGIEKMQLVLCDIHLAEGLLAAVAERRSRDNLAVIYYSQILSKHKVSKTDFEQSMQIYFRSADKLALLYEKILADLQQKEAQ